MDLNEFFKEHNKVALAFSGGVDSSYLLYAAIKSGAQVRAYYVNAAFQPQFELDDAMRLAKQLNADMKVLTADVLSNVPVAPTIGNHDSKFANYQNHFNVPNAYTEEQNATPAGNDYYYTYGDVLFIVLNTNNYIIIIFI